MATETIKRVAIIGASGNVGKPILEALLASGAFDITVLTRAQSSAPVPESCKVVRIADYKDVNEVAAALKGQDALVAAVPDVKSQYGLIDAAIKAGVKRFISSEYGCDTAVPEMQALISVYKDKAAVEHYLKSKEAQISWSSVITGPFFDWNFHSGLMGFTLKEHKATLYDVDAPAHQSTSTLAQIGRAVVGVLQHPRETANRAVYVHSFVVTGSDILARLERISGRKWQVAEASTYDAEREGKELEAKGEHFPALFKLLLVPMWRAGTGADYSRLGKDDNKLLGLETEDLDAVLTKLYADSQKA